MMLQINTPRWALPLLEPDMRYRGAHGGRGSGKSHFFAEMLVERAVESQLFAVCIREVQKSLTQSSKQLIENKIETLGVGHLFEIQRDKITCSNGSLIIFMGLQNHTADSIKSIEGIDVVWIEEAQSISAHSLELLRPTLRKKDAEIWASWNPENPTDAIEFIRGDAMPRTVCVEVNYTDNPWFSETSLPDEMEYDRSRDIDRYNHVWLGQFQRNSKARVFNNWTVDEFEAPESTMFKQGADWGYANDPTVLIRCYIAGNKLYIDYEAHQHQCEIVNLPHLFASIPDSHIYPIIGDSSRPETISHMKNNGYPRTYASAKGKGSVKDGVEWLKSYDIVVHPRCKHTIDELTNYCYIIDKDTNMITSRIKDENNHVIDALRYACEAARKITESKTKHITPQPQRNHWNEK